MRPEDGVMLADDIFTGAIYWVHTGTYVLSLSSVSGLAGSYQASVARELAVNQ